MNLSKYKIPLGSLPAGAQEVANQKTKELEFINYRFSPKLVQDDLEDGVYKDLNHSYFVKCTTRMDGVNPAMIDWWFDWHLPDSERYKLWHPRDHIASRLDNNRDHLVTNKERYIGMDSYVEEYIGKKLFKLCISFIEPSYFGFKEGEDNSTSVCAIVTDLSTGVKIARLLHHVSENHTGSLMKSYFWMGTELSHPNPLKNWFVQKLSKLKLAKRFLLNDQSAKDLLIHCYEEMNHLSKFLPDLHKALAKKDSS